MATFGNTTIESSTGQLSDNILGLVTTSGDAGLIKSITAYLDPSGTRMAVFAIYDADDDSLLGTTEEISVSSGANWYTAEFTNPVEVEASHSYYLLGNADGSFQCTIARDSESSAGRFVSNSYDGTMPDPSGTANNNFRYSIYATYVELTDNLVSYWKLDETSGTRVDSHGSNDLTDNNTVGSGTGIIGNGADFEASNSEYLSITDAAQSGLDLTGDCSFSFWINPESVPSGDDWRIISKWSGTVGNRPYLLRYKNEQLDFFLTDDGSSSESYSGSFDLGTGTFRHVVFTWDASESQGEWYVDGVRIASPTGTKTSIFNGSVQFTIGRRSDETNGFVDGILDEVGIWDRVLTSDEVTALYNSGAGFAYPFVAAGGGDDKRPISNLGLMHVG